MKGARPRPSLRCPECGASEVARAPTNAYSETLFLVGRPYRCAACGLVFVGPTSLWACGLGAALGILGAASCVIDVVDRLASLRGAVAIAHIVLTGLSVLGALCAVWVVYVSVGTALLTLRYRR